ncbi:KR domain-containing protein, partial [Streptomyces sp. NPDC048516]|uniref:KR domain-containing protein n=1 Tax=Streptomyces sp. NPDC048516 TaxID=3365565 RepID=UPI0037142736
DTLDTATTIPLLRQGHPDAETLTTGVTQLHTHGTHINWTEFFKGTNAHHTELPTYPFQHKRYWIATDAPGTGNDAKGSSEERFWDAVERADLDALATTLRLPVDQRESLATLLPAMSTWRRQRHWTYHVIWEPVPEPARSSTPKTWLLVRPLEGRATGLSESLTALGDRVIDIATKVTVQDGSGLADLLREALAGEQAVDCVLSLLALDDGPEAPAAGLSATVALTRTLDELGVTAPLWLATSAGLSVTPSDSPDDPRQAAFWGLGQALAAERPDFPYGLVDLPAAVDVPMAGRLSGLLAADGEHQLALRPSGAFARRLAAADVAGDGAEPWQPSGTLLLAGAANPLGARLVRWAAGHHGAHVLFLLGPGDAESPVVAELRSDLGERITVVSCDLADAAARAELLRTARAGQRVSAVVHVATYAGAPAVEARAGTSVEWALNEADIAAQLDVLAREADAEVFVLLSSVTGMFGVPGLGDTALAHASIDATAGVRRAAGLPVLQLSVVPEQEANPGIGPLGIRPVPPETVPSLVERARELDGESLVIADVDWEQQATRVGALHRGLFRGIPATHTEPVPASVPDRSLAAQLGEVPEDERFEFLLALVRRQSAALLGHCTPDGVDADADFLSLGFSSITALELSTRLRDAGVALSPTDLYDYPTPTELAEHLLAVLGGGEPETAH